MISYRFPVLLAVYATCLGFASSHETFSNASPVSLSGTEEVSSFQGRRLGGWELGIIFAQSQQRSEFLADEDEKLQATNSTYDRSMQAGYKATQQRNYPAALQQFKQALAQRPDDLYAQQAIYNVKSYIYNRSMQAGYKATQQRDYPAALQQFKQALFQRPDDLYAQQAIYNVEQYLENEADQISSQPSRIFWVFPGLVVIAIGMGGGLLFLLWMLRRITPEAEPNYSSSSEGKRQNNNNLNHSSAKVPEDSSSETKLADHFFQVQKSTLLPNFDLLSELIKDLQEPDPKKRHRVIWDLAQRGDSRAVKPLVEQMINSSSQERSLILEALTQISARTLQTLNQALMTSLQDENADVRKNALRNLTKIYDSMSQVSQMLGHAIDDPDTEVQETARWTLNHLNRLQMPSQADL